MGMLLFVADPFDFTAWNLWKM